MAIIHNNVLNSHLDDLGNRILDFPVTKAENVDGLDERIKQVAVLAIDGYDEAGIGQSPSKTEEGLEWFTPVKLVYLGNEDNPIEPTSSGNLVVPVAGETLGVVKESSEIGIEDDGSVSVKSVNADKIMYNDGSSIKTVLNDRTSWKPF